MQTTPFYLAAISMGGLMLTWILAEVRRDIEEQQSTSGRAPRGVLSVVFLCAAASCAVSFVGLLSSRRSVLEIAFVGVVLTLGLAAILLTVWRAIQAAPGSSPWGARLTRMLALVAITPLGWFVVARLPASSPAPVYGLASHVSGTCLSGRCGLIERAGAGSNYRRINRHLIQDGTPVHIICQKWGKPPTAYSSPIWDELAAERATKHGFVSDAFIDTRDPRGKPNPDLRLCS